MARLLLLATLMATAILGAAACALPPFGCSEDFCNSLTNVPAVAKPKFIKEQASTWDKRVAYWYGLYNKQYNEAQKKILLRKKGGPSINYESFYEIGFLLKASKSNSLSRCCNECRKTDGCWVYQYFDTEYSTGRITPSGFQKGYRCYLLTGGRDKSDEPTRGAPRSGSHTDQVQARDSYSPKFNPSWVGGLCNGNGSVVDDPHFTGAAGTPFDFNGELDKSFCLTTDSRLHINVVLKGYKDDRNTDGAHAGIRSWIKEVGVLWTDESSTAHSLHLVARGGKQQERGTGFLAAVYVDGERVEVPTEETSVSDTGMTLAFKGVGKTGPYDVDRFSLKIDGLLDMGVSMRVAHPKLQAPDDAEVHFNLVINDIATTDKIHGVLGQTYRATPEQQQKALKYSEIARLLHGRVAADGESGRGFLDGQTRDYETSSVLAANCKFSSFAVSK